MSTKIEKIYQILTKKQINSLQSFFESSYLVPNSFHINLFKLFSLKDHSKLTKELTRLRDSNSDSKIKKAISEHYDYLKKFISLESFSINEIDKLTAYTNLNIETKLKDAEIKNTRKKLEKLKSENYYSHILDDYNLTKIEMDAYLNKSKVPFEKLKSKFIDQNEALDNFYLWNKVRLLCSYYNLNSVLNFEKILLLQKEVEELLLSKEAKFNLAIELYWTVIQIRKDINKIHLFEEMLQKLKTQEFFTLHYSDQKEIYQYTINLCITFIVRKNQVQHNQTLFELYKTSLEKKYLTNYQGLITQRTFKNIVRCALNNNQFEWTQNILRNTSKLIPEKDVQDSIAYNYGVYYYYTHQFKKSLSSFSELRYDNLFYAVDLRTFLIRLYFELEEIDSLFSLIESFRVFLKRNKTFSKVMINSFRNFLNTIKKIANTNPRDIKSLEKIKNNLLALNPVVEKKWLISIIDKRINKLSFLKNNS